MGAKNTKKTKKTEELNTEDAKRLQQLKIDRANATAEALKAYSAYLDITEDASTYGNILMGDPRWVKLRNRITKLLKKTCSIMICKITGCITLQKAILKLSTIKHIKISALNFSKEGDKLLQEMQSIQKEVKAYKKYVEDYGAEENRKKRKKNRKRLLLGIGALTTVLAVISLTLLAVATAGAAAPLLGAAIPALTGFWLAHHTIVGLFITGAAGATLGLAGGAAHCYVKGCNIDPDVVDPMKQKEHEERLKAAQDFCDAWHNNFEGLRELMIKPQANCLTLKGTEADAELYKLLIQEYIQSLEILKAVCEKLYQKISK